MEDKLEKVVTIVEDKRREIVHNLGDNLNNLTKFCRTPNTIQFKKKSDEKIILKIIPWEKYLFGLQSLFSSIYLTIHYSRE